MGELLGWVETHGLAIVISVTVLYFAVRITNVYVKKLEGNVGSKKHDKLINLRYEVDLKIQMLIDRIRAETHADRLTVYEFHNGTMGAGGLPFLYMSLNHEVYREGLMPLSNTINFKNIQTSHHAIYLDNLNKNPYVILDETNRNKTLATMTYELLVLQDETKSLGVKIVDCQKKMIGFISIKKGKDFTEKDIDKVTKLAIELGILLGINHK